MIAAETNSHQRKVREQSTVCLFYQLVVARPEQKASFFATQYSLKVISVALAVKDERLGLKGKNVVPVVVLGGHELE